MFLKQSLIAVMLVLAVGACAGDLAAPVVPLAMSVSVRSVDGNRVPAPVEERPGAIDYLAEYTFTLDRRGLWHSSGIYNPAGAEPTTGANLWDNGTYRFDGSTLVLHSNFSHTDWPATIRGDTISATIILPIGDGPHVVVMW